MVSSLSFAHKSWERSWNYPQKFPQDQGQSSEQNLGQSQQLCFFLPPTYLRRAVCLLPRTRPPPAGLGGVWALPAAPRLTAWVGPAGVLPPKMGNLTLTLEGTVSSSGSRHQGGAGGKRPVPWKATTVPNLEKREDPGLQQRSAPPVSPPTLLWGRRARGWGRPGPIPVSTACEQGVRLNFLLGVLLKRLNLWESLGSPVANRTRRSHSGRAFDPWPGN